MFTFEGVLHIFSMLPYVYYIGIQNRYTKSKIPKSGSQNYNGEMKQNMPSKAPDIQNPLVWGDILDELRLKESIGSDTNLARSLGVTRGYISLIRMGKKGLSPRLAEEVFKRLGREQDIVAIETLIVKEKIQSRVKNLALLRRYVVDRAKGICQLCHNKAPFLDRDGKPFLEIHCVTPAKQGGAYAAKNLVAVCPNCNRKMGVNPTQADQEKLQNLLESYKSSDLAD